MMPESKTKALISILLIVNKQNKEKKETEVKEETK